VPVVRSKASRRVANLCIAASATLLFVAACGGGSDDSTTPSGGAAASGGAQSSAFTAYADCMKKNGVTITLPSGGPRVRPSGGFPSGMPRPSGSGGPRGGAGFPGGGPSKPAGVDDATWQKAQQACASVLPSGRPGGGDNGANAAYRNCLSDHGATMSPGMSTADPAIAKAMEACKVLRPSALPTPSS
jgi:hypothetical protein